MAFYLFGICNLLMEYMYILTGNDLLRQIFTSDSRQWSLSTRDNFPTSILIKVSDENWKYKLLVSHFVILQTLFTITFWLAIKIKNSKLELNDIGSEKWSKKLPNYVSHSWIVIIIFIMLMHGFFGYNKTNLIQIGFVMLALLFLINFQVNKRYLLIFIHR